MGMYTGQLNKQFATTSRIDHGGEGEIFDIAGNKDLVAKIFFPKERTSGREQKIAYMLTVNPRPQRATWPMEVLSETKSFAGYIMPKISNSRTINQVYASNAQVGDLEYRIAVAHYLCDAVEEIHSAGQVCGDLNPKNILVDPRGHVTLVDTDSFHICNPNNASRPFRCEKALGEWIAPELQQKIGNGQTLDNLPLPTFTQETDRFAVAIHIFALLMNGCHPFATRLSDLAIAQKRTSVTVPQPIENIRKGFSPFFSKSTSLDIPDYAPPLSSLPVEFQKLFRRAFVDGHTTFSARPTCREWAISLAKWRRQLISTRTAQSPLQLPAPSSAVQTAAQSSQTPKATTNGWGDWEIFFVCIGVILGILLIVYLIYRF